MRQPAASVAGVTETTAPAAAGDLARDRGLVSGVGPLELAGTFVGIVIGAGIFTSPRDIAAAVGSWAPLAYLACALVMAAIMLCFAEASARVPTSGGAYGFATEAFGPYWGWLTGALNWASNVLAAGAVAAAAAEGAATVIPALADGPARAAIILAWFAVLITVNIVGVGFAARFVTAATAIKLIPLLIFVGVGAMFVTPANLTIPLPSGSADIGRAAILCLFMFTGIEAGMGVNGEVRTPARTIPRAIGLSLLIVAVFYIGIQIVVQGLLGNGLATSPVPLAAALATISPALGGVMVAGALISMLGYLAGDAMSSPRTLFAFARDGFLPSVIGRTHARTHAPWIAVGLHCAIAAGLAISGSFASLVIVSTLVVVIVYVIGCAAALRLRARGIEHAGAVTPIPGLTLAAVIAFGAMAWVTLQSTRAEATAIAIFVGGVSLLYLFRRQVRTVS